MFRRVGLLALLVALLLPEEGTAVRHPKFILRCKLSEPTEAYVKRIPPDPYHRQYPFCLGTDGRGCRFGFCPSLERVVGCNLSPHCLIFPFGCGPTQTEGDFFVVQRRHRLRMSVGKSSSSALRPS